MIAADFRETEVEGCKGNQNLYAEAKAAGVKKFN